MGVPSGKGSVGGGLRIGLDSSTWMKPLCSQLAAGLLGALWLGLGLACGARSPAVAKPKPAASAAPHASGPRAPTLDLKARRARAEQEARLETAQLRSGLNPLAQLALDRLETSAEVTRRKDEERVARERGATAAPDTIVGPYELYLLERHQLRLRHWIRDHAVDPTTPAELAQAEQQLGERLKGSPSIRTSQPAWLAYRDAWLDFVHALPAPGTPLTLSEIGVRTVLTRERSEELDWAPSSDRP